MAGVVQTVITDPKVTAEVIATDLSTAYPSPDGPVRATRRIWYRTTLFNAFVIGGVGFTAPGLWNAMNSLGAGGEESPQVVNAANALVFGIMGFLCLLGGPIANRVGLKYTLIGGAVGYPVYSAGLYLNSKNGTEWLVLFGAVTCGLSAGLFWASEGAIALGYPEPEKRGRYMNIWLYFRTAGPLVGGAVVLALNHSAGAKKKGHVKVNTYLIFIALQCLSVPLGMMLTPPEKVQRADGTKVVVKAENSFKAELVALYRALCKPKVLLMLPVFWAAYFNQYSGNFEVYFFGVRARALIGFVSNFATLLSSQIMSQWLDYKRWPVKTRITVGFYYCVVIHIVAWIYAWIVNEQFTKAQPVLDWTSPGFTKGFFVLLLWGFSQQALQNWMYYLLATSTDNISELTRFAGILRGQESFAQAVSFGLNVKEWYGGHVPLAVNTILLGLAIVPTWYAQKHHVPVEIKQAGANDGGAEDGSEKVPAGSV
ncbi:hypothetical protein LTR85_007734 [Meristemomyces frigidus]|nr:hypothetical protein LTR85_007734 [Meristemomyces frigidus]